MTEDYKNWCKEAFENWVRQQIDCWLMEDGAWDDRLEDEEDDFDYADLEWIRDNLKVSKIVVEEVSDE